MSARSARSQSLAGRRPGVVVLSLLFLPIAVADEVKEPDGYWTGPINSPVPATISGGKVIDAQTLSVLLESNDPFVIDVSNSPKRPDGMARDAPWLPLPQAVISGSVWIPDAGVAEPSLKVQQLFEAQLARATKDDPHRPIVIYCHEQCWLSWNAAKRAINHGYRNVRWFPEGIEGWRAAGFETANAAPLVPPES